MQGITRIGMGLVGVMLAGLMAQAGDGGPPEVPLTPVRLLSPTPLVNVILEPASEPNGIYFPLMVVHSTVSPLPKPLPSRTPRP